MSLKWYSLPVDLKNPPVTLYNRGFEDLFLYSPISNPNPTLSLLSQPNSPSATHHRRHPLCHRQPSLAVIVTPHTSTFCRRRYQEVGGGTSLSCCRSPAVTAKPP
ncbi:hypothetical protein PIB30_011448, partial [Stylosanthes scabra]|nr:hypothetical protein [Stylosanthes scabra]